MKPLLLLLCLSGCASWEPMVCPETPFVQQATVTWVRVPDAKAECAKQGVATFSEGGCSVCRTVSIIQPLGLDIKPEHRFCTVFLQEPGKVDDRIAGHEFRHMFGCRHER